jgi:hypothetical protein
MKTARLMLTGTVLLASVSAFAQDPAAVPAPAAETVPAAEAAPAAKAAPAARLTYTDDWRIAVNHDAGSDGDILFQVTPKGGTTQDITVAIKKGTGENDVAHAIKKVFEAQIGTKKYNIEMEDGENVIIEKSMGEKDIALVFVSSTVKGVKVSVHKD